MWKSSSIGLAIAIITAIIIVGHTVAATLHDNIRRSYIDHYTSDLILRSAAEAHGAVIDFLAATEALPVIPDYPHIHEILRKESTVLGFTAVLHAGAEIILTDAIRSEATLWGIEPASYFQLFPDSFRLTEGDFWQEDARGLVLSQGFRDIVQRVFDIDLQVGDSLTLRASNRNTGEKILQVPIRGFGTWTRDLHGLNPYFTDPTTLRYLSGITEQQPVQQILEPPSLDEDALFSKGFAQASVPDIPDATPDYDRILGDPSRRFEANALDSDAWHFVLIDGRGSPPAVQRSLRKVLADNSGVRLETWRWGAQVTLSLVEAFERILSLALAAVLVVSLLVLMNSLVIAVRARTREIGTMRALGAQRRFVRHLVLTEVLLISGAGIVLGSLLSTAILYAIAQRGIAPSGAMSTILLAGEVFSPSPRMLSYGIAALLVMSSCLLASLYPIQVALRVSPRAAMERGDA